MLNYEISIFSIDTMISFKMKYWKEISLVFVAGGETLFFILKNGPLIRHHLVERKLWNLYLHPKKGGSYVAAEYAFNVIKKYLVKSVQSKRGKPFYVDDEDKVAFYTGIVMIHGKY